jgi:lauroyl/myristoyl acyltransferase
VESLDRRWIDATDFEKLVQLPAFTLVAWFVPERFWFPVCRLVAQFTGLLMRSRRKASIARVPPYIIELAGNSADLISLDVIAGWHREIVEVLRCLRPGGWNPEIDLYGEAHLVEALSKGRGVILWSGHFESAALITEMGLAQHSYLSFHLTRPDHGFSASPFGIRFLNPLRLSVENRYLAGRIMMNPGETSKSLRELRQRLSQGRLVSIMARDDRASQTRPGKFFDSERQLPTGPITLARASKAPLVPVFMVRRGPRRFEVIIEAPIEVPDSRDFDTPMAQYARLLEGYVRLAPTAYRSWQFAAAVNTVSERT